MDDRELRQLAGQAAGGDLDAADELFFGMHGPLFAYLYLLGIPGGDVEDIAQEVALQVYRGLKTYRPAQPFLPWMRSIASHVAGNYWRKKKRERPALAAFRLLFEKTLEEDKEETGLCAWVRNRVRECIERLQPKQKRLVRMRYFEELDSKRIGHQLSMKDSAVRMSLARVRDVLRTCLESGGP